LKLSTFTSSFFQASVVIPYVIVAPYYFLGKISLGQMSQTAGAFGRVESAMTFFIARYSSLAAFKAVIDRLPSFGAAIEKAAGSLAIVSDWTDRNAAFFGALEVERNTMRLILMLIVAIAALNIISGLIMLVKSKGKDIGILRTIGAGRGAIMRVFMMSGASVGVLGTLAGVIIGVLFCQYITEIQKFVEWVTGTQVFNADVYFLTRLPAKIDWNEVAGICGLSILMSFVATLLPSWWASRLDPVEALRYE
jgi:lipoprotein-releasing system permease protein